MYVASCVDPITSVPAGSHHAIRAAEPSTDAPTTSPLRSRTAYTSTSPSPAVISTLYGPSVPKPSPLPESNGSSWNVGNPPTAT